MLNIFHEVVASRQWVGLHAQASPGFVDTITHARLPEVLEQLDAPETVKSKVVGANVSIMGFGGGVTRRNESTSHLEPDFRHQLMRVLDVLDKQGTGLLITLDEVHRSQAGDPGHRRCHRLRIRATSTRSVRRGRPARDDQRTRQQQRIDLPQTR